MDVYTNNLLINWFLNVKMSEIGLPHIVNMHIGFVCNRKGYCLYEYPDIGRLRYLQKYPEHLEHCSVPNPTAKKDDKMPISRNAVKGIIMQLFATLHALRIYDFTHGNPSSRTILLNNNPCSYIYDGVHVEGPVTIKLSDFNHSGITVGNSRFYNKSVIADENLLRTPFRPIIDNKTISSFSFNSKSNKKNVNIYRLKDPSKHLHEALIFMYLRHLGMPIYQSSFDAYAFMISLMSEHTFYITVMEDESLYTLWRNMWLPEEFELIQDKILKLHSSDDPMTRVDKVLRVLSGFGLRCDAITNCWNLIKTW